MKNSSIAMQNDVLGGVNLTLLSDLSIVLSSSSPAITDALFFATFYESVNMLLR